MVKNYFKSREIKTNTKIREILQDCPEFLEDYFLGIEQTTSPLTRLNYVYDLRLFFDYLLKETDIFEGKKCLKELEIDDLNKIKANNIDKFLSFVSSYETDEKIVTNGDRGKSRKLSTLKSFFKYFYNRDLIKENVSSKVDMPKIHEKAIIRLETDEVATLLENVENGTALTERELAFHGHTKLRDIAILTLMLGTGIRVSECVGLNIDDVDFETNGIKITRKGGNQEIVYFGKEVEDALKRYLVEREQIDAVNGDPALFLSLQNKRICVRTVEILVKKYAHITTPLKKITPHKLRSTYGTNLYQETNDINIVADVLGHKDVNVTKKHYVAVSDSLRRDIANKVKLRED